MLARFLTQPLSFVVAKGRGEEARALAARNDVELPAAAGRKTAADRFGGRRVSVIWFAPAGLSSMVFIGIAAPRSPKHGTPSSADQELVTAR